MQLTIETTVQYKQVPTFSVHELIVGGHDGEEGVGPHGKVGQSRPYQDVLVGAEGVEVGGHPGTGAHQGQGALEGLGPGEVGLEMVHQGIHTHQRGPGQWETFKNQKEGRAKVVAACRGTELNAALAI